MQGLVGLLALLLLLGGHCAPPGRPGVRHAPKINNTMVHDFEGETNFKNLLYQPLVRAPILGAITGAVAPLLVGAGSSDQSSASFDVGNEGSPSNDATRGAIAGFTGASLGSILESVMRTQVPKDDDATDTKAAPSELVTKGLGRMSVSGVAGASAGALVGVLSQSSNPPNLLQSVASGAVGALAGEAIYEASNNLFQKLDASSSDVKLAPAAPNAGHESAMAVLPVCRILTQPNENGDGQVSVQEFLSVFDKTGDNELSIDEVLAMFDVNSDGKLSEDEVLKARAWFKLVDKNGDGVIDVKELSEALDASGDGQISVPEVARKLFGFDKSKQTSEDLDNAATWMANLPFADEWTSGLVGRLELTVPPQMQLDMKFFDRLPTWEPHTGDSLTGDAKCMFAHSSMNYKRLLNEQSRAFSYFTLGLSDSLSVLRLDGDRKAIQRRLDFDGDGKLHVREIATVLGESPDEIDQETLKSALDLDQNGFFSMAELVEVAGISRRTAEASLLALGGDWQIERDQICSGLGIPRSTPSTVLDFLIGGSPTPAQLEAFHSILARTTAESFFDVYATQKQKGSAVRDVIHLDFLKALSETDFVTIQPDVTLTKSEVDLNGDNTVDAKELALAIAGDITDNEALIGDTSLDKFTPDSSALALADFLLRLVPSLSIDCCGFAPSKLDTAEAEIRSLFEECDMKKDECGECVTHSKVTLGAVVAALPDASLETKLKQFLQLRFGEVPANIHDFLTDHAREPPISCDQIHAWLDKDGGGTVDIPEFRLAMKQFESRQRIPESTETRTEAEKLAAKQEAHKKQEAHTIAIFESFGSQIMIKTDELVRALLPSSSNHATFADVLRVFGDSAENPLSFQEIQNAQAWFEFTAMPHSKGIMALFELLISLETRSLPSFNDLDFPEASEELKGLDEQRELKILVEQSSASAIKLPSLVSELEFDQVINGLENLDRKLAELQKLIPKLIVDDPYHYLPAWRHAYCPNSDSELSKLKGLFIKETLTTKANTIRIFKSLPIRGATRIYDAASPSSLESGMTSSEFNELAKAVDTIYGDSPNLKGLKFTSTFIRDVVFKHALYDPQSLPPNAPGQFWLALLSLADGIVGACQGDGATICNSLPRSDVLTMHADARLPQTVDSATSSQCGALVAQANQIKPGLVPKLLELRSNYCARVSKTHFDTRKIGPLLDFASDHLYKAEFPCTRFSGNGPQLSMWTATAQEVLLNAYFPNGQRQAKLLKFQAVQALDPNKDGFVSIDEISEALGVDQSKAKSLIQSVCAKSTACGEDDAQKAPTADFIEGLFGREGQSLDFKGLNEKLQLWELRRAHLIGALTFNTGDDTISPQELAVVLAEGDSPSEEELAALAKSAEALVSPDSSAEKISIADWVDALDADKSGALSPSEFEVLFGEDDEHRGQKAQNVVERIEMLRMAPSDVSLALHVIDVSSDEGLTATKFAELVGERKSFPLTKAAFEYLGVMEKTERLKYERIAEDSRPELSVPDLARVLFGKMEVDVDTYKAARTVMSKLARTVRISDLREFLDPEDRGITQQVLVAEFGSAAQRNHELLGHKPSISFEDFAKRVDPSGTGFASLEMLSRAVFGIPDSPSVRKFTAMVHRSKGAVNLVYNGKTRRDHRLREACPPAMGPLCGKANEPDIVDKNLLVLASMLSFGPVDATQALQLQTLVENSGKSAITTALQQLSLIETDEAFRRLRAMVGLYIPDSVSEGLATKSQEIMQAKCTELRTIVQTALTKAGFETTPESLQREFMAFAVYLQQARIMGSNEVVPPPSGVPWMQRWSYFELVELPPCPALYPEFGARVAAMYKLDLGLVESPKVDFSKMFDDDTLHGIATCISTTTDE